KLEGIVPITQFGRMCQKLGIELIGANSPQAKGRVERGHGTHQDRLIKKMRVKGIRTYEEANRYLAKEYLAQHNGKYAVVPREAADYHFRVPPRLDLEQVFCLEEERIVASDWVVQYGGWGVQLERDGEPGRGNPKNTGLGREHPDGSPGGGMRRSRLTKRAMAARPRHRTPP